MGFYVTSQTLSLGRQPNLQLLFYYFDGTEILVLLHPNNEFKQKLLMK
jgi:hypothetical protein